MLTLLLQKIIIFAILLINTDNIIDNYYQERMKILSNVSIFEIRPYKRNIMHLNANCNVSYLAEYLFVDFPTLIINRKCDNCNHENVRKMPLLSVNVNILLQNGLSEIRTAMLDENHEQKSTCKKCQQIITEKYDFEKYECKLSALYQKF